jgi:hypothetical protein
MVTMMFALQHLCCQGVCVHVRICSVAVSGGEAERRPLHLPLLFQDDTGIKKYADGTGECYIPQLRRTDPDTRMVIRVRSREASGSQRHSNKAEQFLLLSKLLLPPL